ncbi:MAG: RdgB/HAM1 family non-canonical purine NTP pyrophosphatase [candidate division Zixibacteria bacterium]|nr:RdgB/HAM1 family non-canonical purine NTP pyrophosphatase [candidate division Zixibacteria bacterium]
MTHPTRIILATNNPHKVSEIRAILADAPFEVLDASAIDSPPDPDETGSTLEENAIIKAKAFYEASGLWSLADDSGLEIDSLGGDPGVHSARYAGPGCTFADNNSKVLKLMDGVPDHRRTARFRCVAALVTGPDDVRIFEGAVEGIITTETRGTEGFGYDPIFYASELGHTFAEASAEEKNRISHRGRAFRAAGDYLRGLKPA